MEEEMREASGTHGAFSSPGLQIAGEDPIGHGISLARLLFEPFVFACELVTACKLSLNLAPPCKAEVHSH